MAVLDVAITSPRTGQAVPASTTLTVSGFLRPDNANTATLSFGQISWAGGVLQAATVNFTHASNGAYDWSCTFSNFGNTPTNTQLTLNITIQRGTDVGQACSVFTRLSG